MQVQLITPETTFFSGTAQSVYVPGTLGDFGVLPGHMPFISTMRPGVIVIESEGAVRKVAVKGGVAEVTPEHCTLLAESARDLAGMTQADAQALATAANAALVSAQTDAERKDAQVECDLAQAISNAL